jgi:hypothetical protein
MTDWREPFAAFADLPLSDTRDSQSISDEELVEIVHEVRHDSD